MEKTINLTIGKTEQVNLNIPKKKPVNFNFSKQVSNNYNYMTNRPSINGYVLEGDKQDYDYDLQHKMDDITNQEIDEIIYG